MGSPVVGRTRFIAIHIVIGHFNTLFFHVMICEGSVAVNVRRIAAFDVGGKIFFPFTVPKVSFSRYFL